MSRVDDDLNEIGRFSNSATIADERRERGLKIKLVTLVRGEDPLLEATANREPASRAAATIANILKAELFKKRIIVYLLRCISYCL